MSRLKAGRVYLWVRFSIFASLTKKRWRASPNRRWESRMCATRASKPGSCSKSSATPVAPSNVLNARSMVGMTTGNTLGAVDTYRIHRTKAAMVTTARKFLAVGAVSFEPKDRPTNQGYLARHFHSTSIGSAVRYLRLRRRRPLRPSQPLAGMLALGAAAAACNHVPLWSQRASLSSIRRRR